MPAFLLSIVRGHRELGAFAACTGPALHHGLVARVEPHAFLAVNVMVAEQAALPAADRVERERYGNRHVDADHSRFDASRELARDAAIARVAGDAVAILVRVDELDRRSEVRHAHDRQYGPEDL